MIVETYRLAATNTDVLAAGTSRLASIPYAGVLHLEVQSENADGTNQFAMTVQLPDGSTPIENMIVPAGVTTGGMNADDKFQVNFAVDVGGHVTVSCTESGTAVMNVRATLTP